jgi:hypothetical protein
MWSRSSKVKAQLPTYIVILRVAIIISHAVFSLVQSVHATAVNMLEREASDDVGVDVYVWAHLY